MRLSFTYLVKQDENTWDEFSNSIYLLEKNVLSKLSCDFKILVFSEGSPNLKASKINQKRWVIPINLDPKNVEK